MSTNNMSGFDVILAIAVAGLWGLNFVAGKYALAYFPIYYWLALRFLLCALVLIPFHLKPPVNVFKIFVAGTTFSILNSAFRFKGIDLGMDVSLAVILDKLSTVFSVILGVLIFKEKIRWRTIIGVCMTVIGTLLLFLLTEPGERNTYSFLAVTIGAFFWSVYNIQIKSMKTRNYTALLAWASFLGGIPPFILSLLYDNCNHMELLRNITPEALYSLLFTAWGSLTLAHLVWYRLLNKYDLGQVVPFSLLEPILAILFSVTILQEQLTLKLIIGFAVTFVGVSIIVIRRPHHSARIR